MMHITISIEGRDYTSHLSKYLYTSEQLHLWLNIIHHMLELGLDVENVQRTLSKPNPIEMEKDNDPDDLPF